MSGELATYLSGRYVEFVIYPFSFAEFLEAGQERGMQSDLRNAFQEYIAVGGMPFVSNLRGNRQACDQYLKDVYSSVMLKDIVYMEMIRRGYSVTIGKQQNQEDAFSSWKQWQKIVAMTAIVA